MGIVTVTLCNICRKEVPKSCDGVAYAVEGWTRHVCRGSEGEDFIPLRGEPKQLRVVRGHGQTLDLDLTRL